LENISQRKEESQNFYVRNRMEWERHITELTAEGKDVFQWMFRMEYFILETMH